MSLDDTTLDALVADAETSGGNNTPAPENPDAAQPAANAAAPDGNAEGNKGGEKPQETKEPKDPKGFKTPWPKTAIDVMNRKDKKIEAARKQYEDLQKQMSDPKYLRQKLQELEPAAPQPDPTDPMPDIAKYEDWVKYNQDLTAWNLRQLQKQQQKPEQGQKAADPEKVAWQKERVSHVTNKTKEILTAHPEYVPVFQQNADLLDDLPEATKDILLASDNAALAVLQMAHDGTLDDLPHMAAPLAQKAINEAIARGASLIGAKPAEQPVGDGNQAANSVSQAPAPMKAAKTAKSGAKDPSKMTDAEFRAEFLTD